EARTRTQRAVFDDKDELTQTADRILLGQASDFGIDSFGDLLGDEASGIEREIGEQCGGIECKNNEICERQAKRRRADELTERRHGSCTPHRAPCAEGAARSPCRSWSAAAKYARR